jgi:soluble lytic murein transglycosylase-like protein
MFRLALAAALVASAIGSAFAQEAAPSRSIAPGTAAKTDASLPGAAAPKRSTFELDAKPANPKADYRAIAKRFAVQKNVPYELVDAVMRVESNYNPRARGGDGEYGIMQVMPPTARMLGHDGTDADLADPETNIRLGTTYLAEAWRRADGDICTTVMKYRAGWAETRFSVLSVRYCQRVREHLASIGYPVTGSVPEPTFGFRRDEFHQGVRLGSIAAKRRLFTGKKLRSKVNWAAYDKRMKALESAGSIGIGN